MVAPAPPVANSDTSGEVISPTDMIEARPLALSASIPLEFAEVTSPIELIDAPVKPRAMSDVSLLLTVPVDEIEAAPAWLQAKIPRPRPEVVSMSPTLVMLALPLALAKI